MSRTERNPLAMEHALLGFLRRRPMHGYEIYQQLTDPAGLWLVWRVKQSQLYALLVRLEAEGYIASTLHPQESRPPRKVFRLTRAGRERYLAWVRSAVPHGRELRQDFFGKLYFALQEGPDVAAELLARQREACHAWLADMRAAAPALSVAAHPVDAGRDGPVAAEREPQRAGGRVPLPVGANEPPFVGLVRVFRIGQIEAMLAWLEMCEGQLGGIVGDTGKSGR